MKPRALDESQNTPAVPNLAWPPPDPADGAAPGQQPGLRLRSTVPLLQGPTLDAQPSGWVGPPAAAPQMEAANHPPWRSGSQTVPRASKRRTRYLGVLLSLALIGAALGYWLAPRSGMLRLSVEPSNALVALDDAPVQGGPELQIRRRAGVHRLTVTAPGYEPFDQRIQISARQSGHLAIRLKPAPDTGFDLTSSPPGAMVWLDGQPLVIASDGTQARTNLHAGGIAPGLHVIEIRESREFQRWGQEFTQEPGRTVRLHADLLPQPQPRPVKVFSPPPTTKPEERPAPASSRGGSGSRSRESRRTPADTSDLEDPFENVGRAP